MCGRRVFGQFRVRSLLLGPVATAGAARYNSGLAENTPSPLFWWVARSTRGTTWQSTPRTNRRRRRSRGRILFLANPPGGCLWWWRWCWRLSTTPAGAAVDRRSATACSDASWKRRTSKAWISKGRRCSASSRGRRPTPTPSRMRTAVRRFWRRSSRPFCRRWPFPTRAGQPVARATGARVQGLGTHRQHAPGCWPCTR